MDRREYEQAMRQAIATAARASDAGDVPVGALVLDSNAQVIGVGYNEREHTNDPLAHAEVMAMHEAARARGSWNLEDCTLVVTLEPCPMCAGACIQTRLKRIIFGAWDAKLGACGSIWDIPRDPHIGHTPEVIGGICEEKCQAQLREFFQQKRQRRAHTTENE